MPERSFGRTVRYRRTKIGLSQAQLGELVGRSASSIRSWERDVSTPTDPVVITALSAILDIDGRSLFDKAGVPIPTEETHPTVEEALASLAPMPLEEPIEEVVEPDPTIAASDAPESGGAEFALVLDADSELEAEVHEHLEQQRPVEPSHGGEPEPKPVSGGEPDPEFEPFSLRAEPVGVAEMKSTSDAPAFVSPPEPYVITAPIPPMVEPSYMEDQGQRQVYRVRNLATVVLVLVLVIVLLWSLSNTVEALGDWWDEFLRTLRL
jgi:transcriptional regulator with XRE-family HTH domain